VKRLIILVLGLAAVAGAFDAPEWAVPVSPPEPEPMYALVDVDALNLRDAPSMDGNKIGLLRRGERVEVLAWAVGYDSRESDYVWAEVRAGDLHGYVAAEENNYFWGEWGERYLVVEHAFGEPELTVTADLDSDGAPEEVRVGPGEIYALYEQFYTEELYIYYLPLVLRVEGSFDAEARLADFYLGTSVEEVPAEELIDRLEELGELGWHHNWSIYGLEAGDFNGDGAVELRLTLDCRSSFPSPVMTPTFTRRRVLGFAWEDDDLRCIYGYTERAFVPEYEDGPTGNWIYVEGGVELTPETLRYRAVMCCPEESLDAHRFRPIRVHAWLSELDRVRHLVPPPDYLAHGLWYTTDLEARWVPEAGIYALYCPPGNRYGQEFGYTVYGGSPPGLLGRDQYDACEANESLTLYRLPGSGDAAGTLEAGVWVGVQTYETRDGEWYLVSAFPYAASTYRGAPALAGWTRTPPETEE